MHLTVAGLLAELVAICKGFGQRPSKLTFFKLTNLSGPIILTKDRLVKTAKLEGIPRLLTDCKALSLPSEISQFASDNSDAE